MKRWWVWENAADDEGEGAIGGHRWRMGRQEASIERLVWFGLVARFVLMTHTHQSASELQAGPWVLGTHEALESSVESSVESHPPHTLPKSATGERTHFPELRMVVAGVKVTSVQLYLLPNPNPNPSAERL